MARDPDEVEQLFKELQEYANSSTPEDAERSMRRYEEARANIRYTDITKISEDFGDPQLNRLYKRFIKTAEHGTYEEPPWKANRYRDQLYNKWYKVIENTPLDDKNMNTVLLTLWEKGSNPVKANVGYYLVKRNLKDKQEVLDGLEEIRTNDLLVGMDAGDAISIIHRLDQDKISE